MAYAIVFLEGIITFISPCLLPMLPVYLSYLAAGEAQGSTRRTFVNALGFVAGFSAVFMALGLFAGSIGGLFIRHKTAANLITGGIVVLFGLSFMGVFNLPHLRLFGAREVKADKGFWPSVLFGLTMSLSITPCVGAFLGAALALASQQASAFRGLLMLLSYSMGLGIPFVLSALIIDRFKASFDWIKRHYRVINIVSGLLLVAMGIAMMTGVFDALLRALS